MQIENETSASRNIDDRLVGVTIYNASEYLVGDALHELALATPPSNRIVRIEMIGCEVIYSTRGGIPHRAYLQVTQDMQILWTARIVIGYQGSWFVSHNQPILLRPGLTTRWRIVQLGIGGGFSYYYNLTVNEYLLA